MGRYIRNPYVGKEATSSEEVTEKWLEQAVKIIADQIINREFDDEELQDVGPYTGLSGVAFALNKAAPIVGSKATSTAEKCWQYCERASRICTLESFQQRIRRDSGYAGIGARSAVGQTGDPSSIRCLP
ncbi:hypothetical protein Y032_0079g1283 [Ancylostoma ceylanicum]|uniref:Uncharacterized protein n=1 Tax=Ancylostoma ceylanicum TaxID=53326 RepID=A0A016TT62_9BILA|nr:hypothetical protein Y032_0079g1283 [Ancylostoma ceylanicum]